MRSSDFQVLLLPVRIYGAALTGAAYGNSITAPIRPISLAGGDELSPLLRRAVGKIAKLRFPDSQGTWFRRGINRIQKPLLHVYHGVPDFKPSPTKREGNGVYVEPFVWL